MNPLSRASAPCLRRRASLVRLLVLLSSVPPAGAAAGFERPGQPEVLAPAFDESAETARALADARRTSGLRGKTVALYWNRDPAPAADPTVKQTTIDRWEAGSVTPTAPGGLAFERSGRTVVTEGAVAPELPARDGPSEREGGELRAAFVQTLRAAGVRLVDAPRGARRPGRADVVLVVLLVREPAAEHGWSFRISASDASRSTVLTEFATFAEKGPAERAFVATDRGFARRSLTLHDVGETLARETLNQVRTAGL